MIICGIKLTHDGAVALIDQGRLVFSIEKEKLNNNQRYREWDKLDDIFSILEEYGYAKEKIDVFVIDGWHAGTQIPQKRKFGKKEIDFLLAPYIPQSFDDSLLKSYSYQNSVLSYESYTHLSTHVLGAYCSSPFSVIVIVCPPVF